jgi:uncharacterized membrane protein
MGLKCFYNIPVHHKIFYFKQISVESIPAINVSILCTALLFPVISSLLSHAQLSLFPAQLLSGAVQGIERAEHGKAKS